MAQVVAFIIKISIFRFKALPIPIPIPINSRPIPIPIPINSRPIPIPTNAAQFQFLTWNWNWCIPTQYPLKQVRVVYDVTARIGHNFTTKDKIPTELRSGVVYEATCPVCNEKYIGETCRHLKTRINEHLSYQKRVMPPLTQPQTTTTTTTEQPQKSIINSTFHMITRSKSRMNQQLLDQRKLLPKLSTILTIEKKTANLSSHNKVQKKLVKTKSKPKNITTIHKKLTEDDIDDILKNTTTVEKKNVDIIPKSALSKHFAATGHRFNADDFDILLSDYHRYRLVIKESLLIIRRNPTLNVNERSMPLYIYPDGLSRATMTEAKQRPSTKRTTMGTPATTTLRFQHHHINNDTTHPKPANYRQSYLNQTTNYNTMPQPQNPAKSNKASKISQIHLLPRILESTTSYPTKTPHTKRQHNTYRKSKNTNHPT
ncbi:unnamed protein product [Rotaria magnacalcarata]